MTLKGRWNYPFSLCSQVTGAILIISGRVPSIMTMDIARHSHPFDFRLEFNHHLGYAVQYDPGHGHE